VLRKNQEAESDEAWEKSNGDEKGIWQFRKIIVWVKV